MKNIINSYLTGLLFISTLSMCSCQKPASIPEVKSQENTDLNMPKGVKPQNFTWKESTGELRFTSSLSFSDQVNQDLDKEGFYWEIPTVVKTVSIAKNVTVTGGLRAKHSILIQGEDRKSSVIYGTESKNWSLGPDKQKDPNTSCTNGPKGDDYVHDCEKWKYGAISSEGDENTVITVKNLTIENARSYAITGFKPRFVIDNVLMTATRPTPDYQSNSDGVSAGAGSKITNSKIDLWDDGIKLYRDFEVENVTIIHNSNGAPFQFGWGEGIKESSHSLKNVLVIANNQSHSNLALFSASLQSGAIKRNVTIDGIKAIYTSTQKVRNEFPMPLVWSKSTEAEINITFIENSIVDLSAPIAILGEAKINSNLLNKENNSYNIGDSSKITGCGW